MPTGPGGLDPNGIWLYGEDDTEALASDLLNLGMQSVSDALADVSGVVNTDGDPGGVIYVGSVDPDGVYTLQAGDVWIETP